MYPGLKSGWRVRWIALGEDHVLLPVRGDRASRGGLRQECLRVEPCSRLTPHDASSLDPLLPPRTIRPQGRLIRTSSSMGGPLVPAELLRLFVSNLAVSATLVSLRSREASLRTRDPRPVAQRRWCPRNPPGGYRWAGGIDLVGGIGGCVRCEDPCEAVPSVCSGRGLRLTRAAVTAPHRRSTWCSGPRGEVGGQPGGEPGQMSRPIRWWPPRQPRVMRTLPEF